MKETTEVFVAGFKTINAWVLANKDGKLDGNDLQLALPLIFSWQAGIKDLRFASETAAATPANIDAMFNLCEQELTALTPENRYAITNSIKGGYVAYWGLAKASFQAGQQAVVKRLKDTQSTATVLKEFAHVA